MAVPKDRAAADERLFSKFSYLSMSGLVLVVVQVLIPDFYNSIGSVTDGR